MDGAGGVDIACRTHDLLYGKAKTKEDIRKADEKLIEAISKSTAGSATKKILKLGLKAKTLGEDVGLLSVSRFAPQVGSGGRLVRSIPSRRVLEKRKIIKNDKGSMVVRGITGFSGHNDRDGSFISGDPTSQASLRKMRGTGLAGVRAGAVKRSDTGMIIHERRSGRFPQRGKGVANPSSINPSGSGAHLAGQGLLEDLAKSASSKIGKEAIKIAKKVEKAVENNPLVKEAIKRLPADKLREVVLKQIGSRRKSSSTKSKKRKSSQSGGQFATLASIAAGLLLPEVIKGVKKLVSKKKKRKKG